MFKRICFFAYGLTCYAIFLATFLYAIAFVGGFVVPNRLDGPLEGSLSGAIAVNCALLMVFAVQHSVMARRWFKERWTQIIPWTIERSTYVLCASLALALLIWQWRPIGIEIWSVENDAARAVLLALFAAGWATVLVVTFLINHFDLFGLRQVWLPLVGRPYTPISFRTPLPYRYVRHPLYFGFLMAFWATPHMTLAHLVFAVATTAYIVLAIQFEERDLVAEHGAVVPGIPAQGSDAAARTPAPTGQAKPRRESGGRGGVIPGGRLVALLSRPHHERTRQLVVPALLARVEGDPDEAEQQHNRRNVVREVAPDHLPGGWLAKRLRIHNFRTDRHLAGRRLAVDPEKDDGDCRQHAVDQDVGRAVQPQRGLQIGSNAENARDRHQDDYHQDRINDRRADAGPEADVYGLRFVHGRIPLSERPSGLSLSA